ncbi:MAG: branched-chain amino acid transferase [Mesorhizobium sp.]|uniref:aminotransferase class IV n=1 Tax=Mesorhizobium sp. TaxID=1871066 RepID=UPI0011F751C2|nr:aminotransferase class IV [Mesorhizobium sp.]TIR52791.1 MAG: branched-chain amino acid transferase [Mesorhizobium sp.]
MQQKLATVGTRLWPDIAKTVPDTRQYPSGVAYVDGTYTTISEAKISVLDWGFLHSDATYDTAHVWNGRFFRLDLHLNRFFGGLEKLRMSIPYNRKQVAEIMHTCVGLSGHQAAYVEVICTRGSSPTFSRDPRQAINRFMVFAVPFGSVANKEQLERGLRVAVSDIVRIPPKSVDPSIKNYHWLDLVRGLYDAYEQGAETALIRDTDGNIAEGPGFNVFTVKGGRLSTPGYSVLPGITRQTVFDICGILGFEYRAEAISLETLLGADEVFITSTAGGVMPVTQVNGQAIGNGNVGIVTEEIMKVYWDRHEHPDWSSPVEYPDS